MLVLKLLFIYNKSSSCDSLGPPETEQKGGERVMQILPKEKGQGLIEYALIIILVAMVVLMMFVVFGPSVGNVFSNVLANF